MRERWWVRSSGPKVRTASTAAAGLQEQFSAHEFRLVRAPSAHHGAVHFAWEIAPLSGEPPVAAEIDFGTLSPGVRIKSIVTFVDHFPPGVGAHG
jgi:hypothetical protein